MFGWSIDFTRSAWWLLLLIPAVVLTLIPYFRLSKKYRRTRNRIISIILHLTAMTLAIFVLAGIQFTYQDNNLENEIILLVDVSETGDQEEEQRDAFIERVLDEGRYDGYKIGIVTFGFTQQYAVPLTYDVESIYDDYLNAPEPDKSATDIAAALTYTRTLFEYPETSKIVLITDGKETDESALGVIGTIVAQGTRVDTAYISTDYEGDDVQVSGVSFPDYYVGVGDEFSVGVTVQSKSNTEGTVISLYDNGLLKETQTVNLTSGSQTLSFTNTFDAEGLHEICIRVTQNADLRAENNEYYSYFYLERYDKILILEHVDESQALVNLLREEDADYDVTVMNIGSEELPQTVNELCEYDQVILNNIANSDMPEGFDEILYSYVYDYGGGLLTAGGSESDDTAHAYNRTDMYGSLYQEMLPVEVINYTPPVGVVVIIDVSGSMLTPGAEGLTKLEWAKQGAIACLDALTERDYIGIMTLSDVYDMVLPLTSATQGDTIRRAIRDVEEGTSTNYTGAIARAGQALVSASQVSKRHIIIVSDGQPGDEEVDYIAQVERFHQNYGITVSVIGIDMTENSSAGQAMQEITTAGGGRFHAVTNMTMLMQEMREDLNADAIKEVDDEPFNPIVYDPLSPLLTGVQYGTDSENRRVMSVQLGGFYGTKLKDDDSVEMVLVGDYEVPIYAQWKFGKGTVGSFMCDLAGSEWSSAFMTDLNGKRFLWNVVENLMPTEDIRAKDIGTEFTEDNYINGLSIITDLEEGQYIDGKIIKMDGSEETDNVISLNAVTNESEREEMDCYVTLSLDSTNQYSRCSFVIKSGGVYKILLQKCNSDGTVVDTLEFYKAFSYSEEYDTFWNASQGTEPTVLLAQLSSRSGGSVIEDLESPLEVFEGFITDISRSIDPTLGMIIAAMVLFLLDIAVRKFKFKWIHELVREHKEKKAWQSADRSPRAD